MKEERGDALLVFCVLSWVYIGFNFLLVMFSFMQGQSSPEEIEMARIAMLEGQDLEVINMMGWLFEEFTNYMVITNDNFYLINIVTLMNLIIGFIGVFLMFRLTKMGFYLYLAYSIIPLLLITYFYQGMTIGTVMLMFTGIIGLIFSLMYGSQLKRMS
ncbi:hypothetical protein [Crocinitomix catalasitica]|uniref:hypothetical protein n=1 Tax=Crocinitomix catalasitica TaxID=184607 RepID=UPI000484C0A9|nr:hypothetical protein [Crocinitomix catalasitica]